MSNQNYVYNVSNALEAATALSSFMSGQPTLCKVDISSIHISNQTWSTEQPWKITMEINMAKLTNKQLRELKRIFPENAELCEPYGGANYKDLKLNGAINCINSHDMNTNQDQEFQIKVECIVERAMECHRMEADELTSENLENVRRLIEQGKLNIPVCSKGATADVENELDKMFSEESFEA
jgi:hypothetical protein